MGKGTKHKADWKETTLQVVLDAKRLYCHSMKIMGNEKVFNPKKTQVVTADKGGLFLGFLFRVTESGKVLMLRDPAKVKDCRRRLRRLAVLVRRGRRSIEDFDNCYQCIRASMSEGNSTRLLRNMDQFVGSLRSEINGKVD